MSRLPAIVAAAARTMRQSVGHAARRWWSSQARWPVIVAAALVILYVVIWQLPPLLAHTEEIKAPELREKALSDARGTLLQALGGFIVVIGVIVSTLTLRLNTKKHTEEREADTLRLAQTERGQITERFTRAIDQLGHNTIDVRLGGIYALEKIAKDSDEDRETVFEVLAAFIREHTREGSARPEAVVAGTTPLAAQPARRPAEDVQAAATVLGRREVTESDRRINLRGVHLEGAYLNQAHLEGARLNNAHLEGAYLNNAHLEGARLNNANFTGADVEGANFTGATFKNTTLPDGTVTDTGVPPSPEDAAP